MTVKQIKATIYPPSKATMPPSKAATTKIDGGFKELQDNLHDLLSKLSKTIEHCKNWPENVDASKHVESTTKLINNMNGITKSLRAAEHIVKTNKRLKVSLQNCLIPMDLLELLEMGLNPDIYSRGLLKEAMGQLAGLKRRKLALEKLGDAIQRGLHQRQQQQQQTNVATKRSRTEHKNDALEAAATSDRPTKKSKH